MQTLIARPPDVATQPGWIPGIHYDTIFLTQKVQ
jgi:hypothetical protein